MNYWSWIIAAVGILGVFIAGKGRWYAWAMLLANEVLWGIYAVVTRQYGFFIASFFYAPVYLRNAIEWYRHQTEEWDEDDWAEFRAGFYEIDDIRPKNEEKS